MTDSMILEIEHSRGYSTIGADEVTIILGESMYRIKSTGGKIDIMANGDMFIDSHSTKSVVITNIITRRK